MDLETENRLAALLMEEARRLRAQADKEGVHAYLCKPNVRARPNSRFLTATVLGVEQANRAVEVSELWHAREKELELDGKIKRRETDKNIRNGDKRHRGDSHHKSSSRRGQEQAMRRAACSSSNHVYDKDIYHSNDDGGFRDDEVEEFLQSRAKRGRGAIGSRMDEPGPYPSSAPLNPDVDGKHLVHPDTRSKEEWECRILGPEKPSFMKSHEPPQEELAGAHNSEKKHHSKQKKRSETSKRKEERKSKHRHHKSRRRRGSNSE